MQDTVVVMLENKTAGKVFIFNILTMPSPASHSWPPAWFHRSIAFITTSPPQGRNPSQHL